MAPLPHRAILLVRGAPSAWTCQVRPRRRLRRPYLPVPGVEAWVAARDGPTARRARRSTARASSTSLYTVSAFRVAPAQLC